jgi:hypothetical protein
LIFSFCGIGYFCNWNDDWEPFVVLNKIEALKEDCKLCKLSEKSFRFRCEPNPFRKNYEDIKTAIQQMGLEYDDKYLFQTDLELLQQILWIIKSLPK